MYRCVNFLLIQTLKSNLRLMTAHFFNIVLPSPYLKGTFTNLTHLSVFTGLA